MSKFLWNSTGDIASIMLLFFFFVFVGIVVWAMRPKNKEKFEKYSLIPLEKDRNDG